MVMTYRRPGVYLEESLLINPADIAGTVTVACFVGVTAKGPIGEPTLCQSWSDFVTLFGNFDPIAVASPSLDVSSRLTDGPYADLAALKASSTEGDGDYTGPAFTAGQYVTLEDASKAHTPASGAASVWAVGPMAGTPPATQPAILSYLPFAVYSFFQNGGRFAWVIRAVDTASGGEPAMIDVNGQDSGGDPLQSFTLVARSVGTWGQNIKYQLVTQSTVGTAPNQEDVFAVQVLVKNSVGVDEVLETWPSLSVKGTLAGTRRVDSVLNDPAAGSQYVRVINVNDLQPRPSPTSSPTALDGGVDPAPPDAATLVSAAEGVTKVEGPVTLNIVGYLNDAGKQDSIDAATVWVSGTVASTSFSDRQDIFIVNDSAPPRTPGMSSATYKTAMQSALGANTGDSYSASYGPWIIIPHPARVGTTVNVPPGGAVIGMMSRIDATVGVFRAPAGVIAGLTNAVGVQTKFTDTELGDLNAQNINVVRSVVGAGICVMGGRTRKTYGVDRYVSARRTLIYIKEVMRRSTQFAIFENNDQRLWSALRMSAERILRPLWEAGGLRGSNSGEAYFIRCDDTINTPSVIQSGEVRMEIGVALEYPAEFVIIRLTQFDQGTYTAEVQPAA